MKRSIYYIAYLFLICIVFSCVGQKEEDVVANLQLVADKSMLYIDDKEIVTFTVLFDENDVTSESLIVDVTEDTPQALDGHIFEPQKLGTYKFVAYYKGVETSPIKVDVIENKDSGTDFYRRAMIMKFTATWCVNCPQMSDAIKLLKDERPNRIVDIAVHYMDELEVESGKVFSEMFSISAIPVTVFNLDQNTQTSVSSSTLLLNTFDKLTSESLKAAGIRLDTYEKAGQLCVEVESTIASEGNYKLAVAIVQDGIVKAQTGGGINYVHNSVLREVLQEPTQGEMLGECREGEVVRRTYYYPIASLEENGKYRVVAYILNSQKNGYVVNNIVECNVKESISYQYE